MTGFARREASGPWGTLVCELRSVNHRFLETGFRLPDDLRSLEPELRQLFIRELKRGKVDCTLTYRAAQGTGRSLDLDAEALERLLARVRDVAGALSDPRHPGLGSQPTVSPLDMLRWPGIVREADSCRDDLVAAGRQLVGEAVADLVAARTREGERLRDLIEQRCAALARLVEDVQSRLPAVEGRVRKRLDERLAELQATVDRDRLEQELALLLQRLDVDEELDRLTAHIAEIRRIVGGSEPAGRRLDFLMQELNREANTLSSKSQDLDTTRAAVDMKVLIEQMREQVQNIE
ncbi:MAG: YicC/YloC family endoribonuclease [Steroidobacteraceae bacterium]